MPWKIALAVALLSGLVTAAVTAWVANKVTGMLGVSDFEGKRGFALVFIFIPAGFIGGALCGLLGTKLVHAAEWAHFWKAAGMSIALGQVALWGIAGLSLLGMPRPPKIAGQELALEIEVHVPLARITPRSTQPYQIRMSLFASRQDNRSAEIDRARYREENGKLIVTAVADLYSKAYERTIFFHIEEHTSLQFDLPLAASPTEADMQWTALAPLHEAQRAGSERAITDVLLRYRVVKADPSV